MKGYSERKLREKKINSLENEQGFGVILEVVGDLSKDSLLPHHCQEVKFSRDGD